MACAVLVPSAVVHVSRQCVAGEATPGPTPGQSPASQNSRSGDAATTLPPPNVFVSSAFVGTPTPTPGGTPASAPLRWTDAKKPLAIRAYGRQPGGNAV